MRSYWRRFWCEDDAATAVEYAIMLVLIVAVVIGSVVVIGNLTNDSFKSSHSKMTSAGMGQ